MPVEPLRVDPESNDDAKWKREVARLLTDLVNAQNATQDDVKNLQGLVN